MRKINLKSYTYTPSQADYSAGDVLRKVRQNQELHESRKVDVMVTRGMLEVTQVSGGLGWAISDLIVFPYKYRSRPIFSWGLDGTYTGNNPTDTPYASTGGNSYGSTLSPPLQAFIDNDDYTTWQPGIFIPRIVQWYKLNIFTYAGCFILVSQVNAECTEINKTMFLHYKLEGNA